MSIINREIGSKKQKTIFILALIAWLVLIFYMSHQPGDDSSGMSREVCRAICQVFVEDFEAMTVPEQDRILDGMEFWIRKGAHCFEYMVLGILLYLNIALYARERRNVLQTRFAIWLASLAAGILYAASDEIHQYFIPGRSCELRDVLIDSLGVLIGVTLILWACSPKKCPNT